MKSSIALQKVGEGHQRPTCTWVEKLNKNTRSRLIQKQRNIFGLLHLNLAIMPELVDKNIKFNKNQDHYMASLKNLQNKLINA